MYANMLNSAWLVTMFATTALVQCLYTYMHVYISTYVTSCYDYRNRYITYLLLTTFPIDGTVITVLTFSM